MADYRRAGAGPARAGQRQGCHVHHHRGRDRPRECRGLAKAVRVAPARRAQLVDDGDQRQNPA